MKKLLIPMSVLIITSCNNSSSTKEEDTKKDSAQSYASQRLAGYAKVRLTADLSTPY